MALNLYNNQNCALTNLINSAYCADMSTALDIHFTTYQIDPTILTVNNIASVYLAVYSSSKFNVIRVNTTDWHAQAGNQLVIVNQDPVNLQMTNRIVVIPVSAVNLCFTGIVGTNVINSRPLWLNRSNGINMYDYITITSINHFAAYPDILEYPGIAFIGGTGTGFYNLTTSMVGMRIDFDGQYVGTIISVSGVDTLTIDSNFTSSGISRAFLYSQGSLQFAEDYNGSPGTWYSHMSIPPIDTDIPHKFWVCDFKTVSQDLTIYVNNSIRILGTEFLL